MTGAATSCSGRAALAAVAAAGLATGARTKDRLENRLHALVCRHEVPLGEAQRAISTDWVSAYQRYFGRDLRR